MTQTCSGVADLSVEQTGFGPSVGKTDASNGISKSAPELPTGVGWRGGFNHLTKDVAKAVAVRPLTVRTVWAAACYESDVAVWPSSPQKSLDGSASCLLEGYNQLQHRDWRARVRSLLVARRPRPNRGELLNYLLLIFVQELRAGHKPNGGI
jgi:hypothetical protein